MGTSKDCQVMELSSRLKREDYTDPNYDSIFGAWKVLIGPSDWENHSLRKEGAERYRVHNLPDCSSSCPGLYELGILIPRAHSRRKTGNLDPHDIIPVYLGQTDNVRTRLQIYGRKGAHLEIGNSRGQLLDYVQQGHQPFSEAFSRGYSVVYRWAPMKNKAEAEKKETRLLDTYDYAWNKGNNGVRRDVFQKLDRKLSGFHQKRTDVKVRTCKSLPWKDGSSIYTDWERNDFLPQIFKFGRSQPRLVTPCLGFNVDLSNICGVALDHGSVCTMPPVERRKRCEAHKGMKVNDLASKKFLTEGKPLVNSSPSCRLEDRKRCKDQKGGKITGSLPSESITNGKTEHYAYGPVLEAPKSRKPQFPVTKYDTICGVDLGNGTFCTEQPVGGNKRCEDHKWMRANKSNFSSVFDSPQGNSTCQSVPYRSVRQEDYYSTTCGATTATGSACRNPPAEGGKRCWRHQGDAGRTHSFASLCYSGGISSDICGASTVKGSICHRTPVRGNKRCWQHAGQRAAF